MIHFYLGYIHPPLFFLLLFYFLLINDDHVGCIWNRCSKSCYEEPMHVLVGQVWVPLHAKHSNLVDLDGLLNVFLFFNNEPHPSTWPQFEIWCWFLGSHCLFLITEKTVTDLELLIIFHQICHSKCKFQSTFNVRLPLIKCDSGTVYDMQYVLALWVLLLCLNINEAFSHMAREICLMRLSNPYPELQHPCMLVENSSAKADNP